MSEFADRYERVAERFNEVVGGVAADRWDSPAPCEGWVARDVVGHLVDWVPGFLFAKWAVPHGEVPPVDDDPVAAWRAVDSALRAALADPEVAGRVEDVGMGPQSFEQAVDQFCTADVLVHTWDLARATGQDETLPAEDVRRTLAGMEKFDEALRNSGHFGPRVEVSEDADDQTKLIAFTGRTP